MISIVEFSQSHERLTANQEKVHFQEEHLDLIFYVKPLAFLCKIMGLFF